MSIGLANNNRNVSHGQTIIRWRGQIMPLRIRAMHLLSLAAYRACSLHGNDHRPINLHCSAASLNPDLYARREHIERVCAYFVVNYLTCSVTAKSFARIDSSTTTFQWKTALHMRNETTSIKLKWNWNKTNLFQFYFRRAHMWNETEIKHWNNSEMF